MSISVKVASTSARPPDRPLIDAITAQRFERCKQLKQEGRRAEYVVLSEPESDGRSKTTAAQHGVARQPNGIHPLANGTNGIEGGAGDDSAIGDLFAGNMLQKGKEASTSSEKAQKHRSAHALARILASGFIVPLCRIDDGGMPTKIHREQYSILDAIAYLRELLQESPDMLGHTFEVRTPTSTRPVLPHESTTLDVWLLPRVLTATAVLSVRMGGLLPSSDDAATIHQALIDLATEVLHISIATCGHLSTAHMILTESLRVSLLALSALGRPSFLTTAPPPMKLLSKPSADAKDKKVCFFAEMHEEDPLPLHRLKPSGSGIGRVWLDEDHATFDLGWFSATTEDIRASSAEMLFLVTCLLCLRTAQAERVLGDLAATVCNLLDSNWQCGQRIKKKVFCETEIYKQETTTLRVMAAVALCLPVFSERLSILVAQELLDAFSTNKVVPPERLMTAFRHALRMWNGEGCSARSDLQEAHAVLQTAAEVFVQRCTAVSGLPATSGIPRQAEERGQLDQEMQCADLACDALLFLLLNAPLAGQGLSEILRRSLIQSLGLTASAPESQAYELAGWLSHEKRTRLRFALRLADSDAAAERCDEGDHMDTDSTAAGTLVTRQDLDRLRVGVDHEPPASLQDVLPFVFCADATTLHEYKAEGTRPMLLCSKCDAGRRELLQYSAATRKPGHTQHHWKVDVLTDLILSRQQRGSLKRLPFARAVRRALSHRPSELDSLTGQSVSRFASIGLILSARADRIVCGKAVADIMIWLYKSSSFKGQETMLTHEATKLFDVINGILESSRSKLKETTLLCVGELGKSSVHEVQQKALLVLFQQLGPNTMSRSLSYSIIDELATARQCTTFKLISPFLDVIAVSIVGQMVRKVDLFVDVLAVIKQTQDVFFQTTLQYTLPRLIQGNDQETLNLIAKGLGRDVQSLCFENAAPILKCLLMQSPTSRRDRSIHIFLNAIRADSVQEINLKTLIKGHLVELLGHLVSHLGSDVHHKAALDGLHYMNVAMNERQRVNKSVSSRDFALSSFLRDEILAILSWYNEELMDLHGKRNVQHKSMVTRSIGILVHLIGEKISNVTSQLMATFNTTMHVPELMLPTLESWSALIDTLKYDDLGPCVGPTVASLLTFWPKFGKLEKATAYTILQHIIVDSPAEVRPFLERDLPRLDGIKEDIPEVWQRLSDRRFAPRRNSEQKLKNVVARAATENTSMCLQALVELKDFVRTDAAFIDEISSGNAFDPVAVRMVSVLLQTVAREDAEIRKLSLEILGSVGALDPDRMTTSSDESGRFIIHDFADKEALTDFAVHLVRTTLIGAFKATNDTKHQAALAYAIQELLKLAGFSVSLLPAREGQTSRGSVVNLRTKQRWNSLTDNIDVLAPLLESKYTVHVGEPSHHEKPFYKHATSFREWIQVWTSELIISAPGDMAASIFTVFRSVIRDHDLTIAQYLLPYLVVDIITMGTEDQYRDIQREITGVLEDQVNQTTAFDKERRLLSAQVVFAILDHLSLWQRSRRRDRQKASRHKRDPVDAALGQVDHLMQAISYDLMAKASLQCRAYARSLFNFEQQIRKLQLQQAPDDKLQEYYENLHLIYSHLDEPDGMEGVSTLVLSPSLDHQIREHESTGRWTSAQSCWEVKIQKSPETLELHHGLLKCLRNLGHYDTMRTHIRGVVATHPQWRDPLNPFYVEGSCILSDWAEVRRSLQGQDENVAPQHAMARVMMAMHDADVPAFKNAIEDARALLGKPLVAAQKSGYIGVYDTVTQLHMLHELELIASAHGLHDGSSPTLKLEEVSQRLASRLESTLPSFKVREPLLSLRRSAFNTRVNGDFQDIIGQSWITSSKIARRAGHAQTAYSAALQAAQWKAPLSIVQHAKLLARDDQRQAALHELASSLRTIAPPDQAHKGLSHSYANAHLFLARLSESTGRGRANEIIEMYKKCTELDPQSEKMWYHLGHYYDQYTEREMKSQNNLLVQHYNVCKHFLKAASCGTKFFYRTVPRVLTIWLMYGDNEKIVGAQRKNKSSTARPDPELDQFIRVFVKLNDTVHKHVDRIAPYQWLAVLPQLVSRVTHKNDYVWKTLRDLICYVLRCYPDQAMWTMIAGSQSKDKDRRSRIMDIVASIKSNPGKAQDRTRVANTVDQMLAIGKEMLYLCDFPVSKEAKQLNMKTDFSQLLALAQKRSIILPLQNSLQVSMPSNGRAMSNHQVFDENLPVIIDLDHTIDILPSLQRPRKIVIKASDGKQYAFLCKPKDDLRKDARLMEFDAMINNLLQSNPESRKRRLYIRTYSVVTLNEECGLIEWVPNTVGLRNILHALYQARNIPLYTPQIKADLDACRADPKRAGEIFEQKIETKYPSVFHEWFITMFPEPSAWHEARLNYGHTLAVMSMVGHVLGLGDRHGENILFDSMTGDTVHVDLNCLFDKGTTFEIPERVPFRLTQNLIDALGVTGCEGVFRRAAEISMSILREHKDSLMSVLEAMVHDPLVEWGIDDRSTKNRANATMREDPRVVEARKSLDPVRAKLDGTLKRQALNDPFAPTTNLSTNSLVDALIREATSNTNLALMYVGWGAYL